MTDRRKLSRIAGFIYLIIVITGMFSLAYVPNQLFDWNSPSKTFDNISHNESLFRYSIASSVLCYLAFILLPIFLYQLLEPVNKFYARIMAILAIVSVPISMMNLTHKYSILSLIQDARQNNALDVGEMYKQIMFHLNQYDNGIFIATLFWGLWLFPFGYLVYKSGFLPKFLGVLLMLGCLAYMFSFFGNTLVANYTSIGFGKYLSFLPAIGEIGTCLWLLIIGARFKK